MQFTIRDRGGEAAPGGAGPKQLRSAAPGQASLGNGEIDIREMKGYT